MADHEASLPHTAVDTVIPMTRGVDKLRTVCGRLPGNVDRRCFGTQTAASARVVKRQQTRVFMQRDGGSQANFTRVVINHATFWLGRPLIRWWTWARSGGTRSGSHCLAA